MPNQMAFSGTIWMLDLHHRVQPVHKMDFCEDAVGIGADGRETECEQGVGKGRGACRISSRRWRLQDLQRVERDADIVAVVLAIHIY